MRLEDWQKWLDSQFIDPAAARQTADQQHGIPEPVEDQLQMTQDVATLPNAGPASVEPRPTETARPITAAPAPIAATTGLVDEVEVPAIERYLPFLRAATARSTEPSVASGPVEVSETRSEMDISQVEALGEPGDTSAGEPADIDSDTAVGAEPIRIAREDSPATAVTTPAPPAASAPVSSALDAEAGSHRVVRRVTSSQHRSRSPKRRDSADIARDLANGGLWDLVPRHLQTLVALSAEEVAQNSYKREFKESRIEMVTRVLDPTLSLEETARLLNVCPTTVRRYTNRGLLTHQRTSGDQRRFKLSDVLAFLESQSRTASERTP